MRRKYTQPIVIVRVDIVKYSSNFKPFFLTHFKALFCMGSHLRECGVLKAEAVSANFFPWPEAVPVSPAVAAYTIVALAVTLASAKQELQ